MKQKDFVFENLSRILDALHANYLANLVLLDTGQLDRVTAAGVGIGPRLVTGFPPDTNILFYNLGSGEGLQAISRVIAQSCPPDQSVNLVFENNENWDVRSANLADLDSMRGGETPTAVFLPARAPELSFEIFQQVVARLRAPDGCPWDREQTHLSLQTSPFRGSLRSFGSD